MASEYTLRTRERSANVPHTQKKNKDPKNKRRSVQALGMVAFETTSFFVLVFVFQASHLGDMVFFLYIFHREDGTHPLDPSPLSLSLSLSPCLRLCVRLFGCVCLSLCLCLSHPLSLSLSLSPSHSVSNPHTSDSNAPTPPPR